MHLKYVTEDNVYETIFGHTNRSFLCEPLRTLYTKLEQARKSDYIHAQAGSLLQSDSIPTETLQRA